MSDRDVPHRHRVLLFAALRDLAGAAEVAVALPAGARAGELIERVAETCPDAAPLLARSRLAADHEFLSPDAEIPAGAELALIPPVSGG